MTKKRFSLSIDTEWWFVQDNTIQVNKYGYRDDLTGEDEYGGLRQELTEQETVDLLNKLYEENMKLQFQFNLLQEPVNEFYRGAKENANMVLVEQLKRENKELKLQLEAFKDKLCELGMSGSKQYDKRFHIAISNDNTVRLVDHERNNDLISIGFKKHSDAADCSDALQYLCNLMNGLAEENDVLRKQLKTKHVTGHLKKSDVKDSHLIIDGNEVNCKIEELRASGYSDEYINKELGHLVNWRI